MKFIISIAVTLVFLSASWIAGPFGIAHAKGIPLIRDAEIEAILQAYAKPIFEAASLDPAAVRILIVRSNELNAFVAGGQNIFLTTGLLMRTDHAGQVIGVLAHEAGHITGGHLARMSDALRRATNTAFISQILAVLAGVAAGEPGAVGAGALLGNQIAERSFLGFTRTQEASADQAGVNFLNDAGISPKGLQEFMTILRGQEFLRSDNQDPYIRTHPLTQERIRFLNNQIKISPYANAHLPDYYKELHGRLRAKLIGFLKSAGEVFRRYPANDKSLEAHYARAIAYYRIPEIDSALPAIDSLIRQRPEDAYFHELRGQMLFEGGRLRDALPSYERAVRLAPNEVLLRAGLAHVQLELNDPALNAAALAHLRVALRKQPENPTPWRLAATAFGKAKEFGQSALALAEYNFLIGNRPVAHQQARRAERLLEEGSPSWLRAQDIKRASKSDED